MTIFSAVLAASAFDVAKPSAAVIRNARLSDIALTVLILYLGLNSFISHWGPHNGVFILAGLLQVPAFNLLLTVGILGCVMGAYACYTLVYWLVIWYDKLKKDLLPAKEKSAIISNLKQNWFFPISATAFFILYSLPNCAYAAGLIIALAVYLIISSQTQSILSYCKVSNKGIRVISILTAIGICWAGYIFFVSMWSELPKTQALKSLAPIIMDWRVVAGILCAAVAIYFAYVCVLVFWNNITKIFSESKMFGGITALEWVIYGLLFAVSLALVVFSFAQSEAFYGTEVAYDIIYTSDSPALVKGNAYLALTHLQNDLRQPLFAVFAAPFVGIPYLLSCLAGASAEIHAMLVNGVQILLLFTANLVLAKMLKLDSTKRIYFMMLTSCTYTQLLFTLMMEQYIVAYFWLIFCVYLIAEKRRTNRIALWGAGGTLLTSIILLPLMSDVSPVSNFKAWLTDMVKNGLGFILLILAFCRFDLILNLMSSIAFLSGFTGKAVAFTDKFYQYTEFIANCFFAPSAGVDTTTYEHISWKMNTVTGIDNLGILILVLAIISAIWNRDKRSSLLAAGWVVFSSVMLLVLGWGTVENGLILYALYFGWAFLMLLFQLAEKIESTLNVKFFVPAFSICTVAGLLRVNIPAIMELVEFAIAYYPV